MANKFFANVPKFLFWFMLGLLAVEIVEHSLHVVGELLPLILIATILYLISRLFTRKSKVAKQK